jgi:hypothetical protein
MVLLYSARLSRRMVTRPGSLGVSGEQSIFVSEFSIQLMTNSFSSLVGCGFFDAAGGISPLAMTCCIADQFLRSLRACASLT